MRKIWKYYNNLKFQARKDKQTDERGRAAVVGKKPVTKPGETKNGKRRGSGTDSEGHEEARSAEADDDWTISGLAGAGLARVPSPMNSAETTNVAASMTSAGRTPRKATASPPPTAPSIWPARNVLWITAVPSA